MDGRNSAFPQILYFSSQSPSSCFKTCTPSHRTQPQPPCLSSSVIMLLKGQGIREIRPLRCYKETSSGIMHCTWVEPGEGAEQGWTESQSEVFSMREPPDGRKAEGKGAGTGDVVRVVIRFSASLWEDAKGPHPSGWYTGNFKTLGQRQQHDQGPQAIRPMPGKKMAWTMAARYLLPHCSLRSGRWSWASWRKR